MDVAWLIWYAPTKVGPSVELRTSAANVATKVIALLAAAMYAWIGVATGPGDCGGAVNSGSVVCMHARLCHQFGEVAQDDVAPVKSCCHKTAAARHSGPTVEQTPESCHCCAKAPGSSVASRVTNVLEAPTLVHYPIYSQPRHAISNDELVRLACLVHGRPPPNPCGVESLRARRACAGLLSSRLVI